MSARDRTDPSELLEKYLHPPVSGVSKYAQLRETLTAAIRAGHWKPGGQLPPERELVRMTGFSLGTVQRALRELANDGLLVRTQGSGTYVAQNRRAIDAPLHLRFLGRAGEPPFLPLFPKVLSRERVSALGPWSEWLGQRGANVIRIDRRISVNGEFNVFNRFYLNADAFPGIAEAPLAQLDGANLKQMVGTEIGMPVTAMRQRVCLLKLPSDATAALGVKAGTHGMLLESATTSGRHPLYFLESFIPPNERRLDVSPA